MPINKISENTLYLQKQKSGAFAPIKPYKPYQ